ncbi:hypothetical protein FHP29_07965 [Nocardioides albidus]|uniref:Uncharacterized protein n=1 Tax=Nocardioides albidus TaxID=1517589 RepID=A0A5C4W140_9ACTN|nr:hypothetical protein [Nocardioides albidus]TNM41901.1 hypothetical protein FHP29_07965 [Nocardioides albidus]
MRDLVDLQLLDKGADLDLAQVKATCIQLFDYRRQKPWPPTIESGAGWDTLYETVIEDMDVLPDVGAAVAWVDEFVQRIEAGACRSVIVRDRLGTKTTSRHDEP